jgi:hypothetical protein
MPDAVRPYVSHCSLTNVSIGEVAPAEMVVCTEVAEHLPGSYSAALVALLTGCALRSIIFSAAKPGQWGDGHINCMPQAFWEDLFYRNGWTPNATVIARMKDEMSRSSRIMGSVPWIADNLVVFERGAG